MPTPSETPALSNAPLIKYMAIIPKILRKITFSIHSFFMFSSVLKPPCPFVHPMSQIDQIFPETLKMKIYFHNFQFMEYFTNSLTIILTTPGKEGFTMKMYFSQKADTVQTVEEDLTPITLRESIEKTHRALDIAYAGFNNATDPDLIDGYIYEINSLQKKYKHLSELAALETVSEQEASHVHSPIRSLVSHVFS